MEPNTDPQDVIETPAPEADTLDTETSPETEPEATEEELSRKVQELEEKNKKLYARAKAAEEKAKGLTPAPSQSDNLSTQDMYSLLQAQVPQEDMTEVVEYARFKKLSIADALKSNVVKTLLSDRAEERKTASATYTGTTRRAPQKVQSTTLIAKAEQGDFPDNDDDMARLWKARKGLEK